MSPFSYSSYEIFSPLILAVLGGVSNQNIKFDLTYKASKIF